MCLKLLVEIIKKASFLWRDMNAKNLVESLFIGEGESKLEVLLKRHLTAKNIRLRINLKNQIILTVPKYIPLFIAKKFLFEKEAWIRARLLKKETSRDKNSLSILGKEYKILYNQNNLKAPVEYIEDKILVASFVKEDKLYPLLELQLKKIAKKEIEKCCYEMADKLKVSFNQVSMKDTVTRWGSCSRDKKLSFSWRLVLAPKNVMEYVVAHEVCHLIEMNHSSKFWNLVYQIYPNYFDAKLWLKKYGRKLFSYLQDI